MITRKLGNTDLVVSALGMGGHPLGLAPRGRARAIERMVRLAVEHGINTFDTAECYGESEARLGRSLRPVRDRVYLFGKCGHDDTGTVSQFSKDQLATSVERSLLRLNTDYLDLLQLHSCSEEILRQGDAIEFLRKCKQEGKVRYIGYSGEGCAARFAVACGAFDSLQVSVNVIDQSNLADLIPEARARGLGIIAKRPVANAVWRIARRSSPGLARLHPARVWRKLCRTFAPLAVPPAAAPPIAMVSYRNRWLALRDALPEVSIHPLKTALGFVLTVPGVDTAIVGVDHPDQLRQNLKILQSGMLDDSTMERLYDFWRGHSNPRWSPWL